MLRSKELDNYNHALFLSNFYMVVVQKVSVDIVQALIVTLMFPAADCSLYVEAHSVFGRCTHAGFVVFHLCHENLHLKKHSLLHSSSIYI